MANKCRLLLAIGLTALVVLPAWAQLQDKEQSKVMVELAGEMLKASQAEDDVRDIMVQAADLDTTNIQANFEAARLHLRTIRKHEASKYLLRIYRQKPTYRFDLEYHIAASYQYGLQFDMAIAFYNKYKQKYQKQPGYQGKDKVSLAAIERKIYECNNGKEFVSNPKPWAIINIGPQVNSEYNDYAPVLNEKEDEIIFTSRRLDGNLNENVYSDNKPYEDIFFATKGSSGKWTKAANIGRTVNIPNHNSNLAISPDGKTLYSYRDDNGGDIFVSELKADNTWSAPKPLPGVINSPYMESSVSVTPDGSTLYFASERDGGYGGLDIYICTKDSRGNWSRVKNMGPTINTEGHEDGPFIDYSAKKLYFSSEGHKGMGGYDIFETSLINPAKNEWSQPLNLGYPINTPDNDIYFVGTADGKRGYYASVREDGLGYLDIYTIGPKDQVKRPTSILPVKLVVKVIDAKDNSPLEANIELLSIAENTAVPLSAKSKGNYTFTVTTKDPKNYRLSVRHDGYFPQIEEITLQSADVVEKTITRTVGMAKSKKDPIILPLRYLVKITDSKTNAPLDATVKLISAPDNTAITATARGAGSYEFQIITPTAKTYKLSVDRNGYASQNQNINLEGASTVEKVVNKAIALVETKPVVASLKYVVKVVDSKTNQPIDALVKLETQPEKAVLVPVSNIAGTYEFTLTSTTPKNYSLTVEKTDYETQTQVVSVDAAGSVEKIVSKSVVLVKKAVVLAPIKITVKVVEEKTNAILEAYVKLESVGESPITGMTSRTTGIFDFSIKPSTGKEYTVTAERKGYNSKSETITIEAAGAAAKTVSKTIALTEIKKEPVLLPITVSVKVTDAVSKAPLDAHLKLEAASETSLSGLTTKAIGGYDFSVKPSAAKEYTLTVERDGYASKTEKFTIEPAGSIAKTVSKAIVLSELKKEPVLLPIKFVVKIVDEKTNATLDAKLKLEAVGDAPILGSTSKTTGTYEISITPKATKEYTITVERDGYASKIDKIGIEPAGSVAKTTNRTIALKPLEKQTTPPPTAFVRVLVNIIDKKTNGPIEARVILETMADDMEINAKPVGAGLYEFIVTSSKTMDYELSADREGYVYTTQKIRIEGVTDKEKTVNRTLVLQPIAVGVTSVLKHLYFDVGKATIRPESYAELNGFRNMMQENKTIRVEISGHTDNVGDDNFNKVLSQNRANAVKTYLTSKGIDPKRLVAIGYGETRPLVSNDDEDGGREFNRRVEVKILSK
jgi:outer membrane protein OmpA-like peptidoglycan-associated protein